jgi:class 3 adenylate cyclase
MDIEELVQRGTASGSTLTPEDQRELIGIVIELGATEEELLGAVGTHNLGDLAVDLAVRRGRSKSFAEIAREVGLDPEDGARVWRALGFADPLRTPTTLPEDAAAALRTFVAGRELLGEDATLALARVVGTSTARIADALLQTSRVQVEAPQLAAGRSYPSVVRDYTALAREILPQFADAVGALLIRHLVAIASKAWATDAEGGGVQQDLAVGFADITGYTALSRTLTPAELARFIGGFEGAVSDAVSHHGGRVVKLLGDGALFSVDDARGACDIAMAIVDTTSALTQLPAVRVGVAAGVVVNMGGDVFGPVVNLAARLVAVAPERSVVVDEEVRHRVDGEFTFEAMAPQELKGLGTRAAYLLLR